MQLDGETSNVVLVYDFKRKSSYVLKGLNLKELVTVNSENYSLVGVTTDNVLVQIDNSSTALGVALTKSWQNSKSDYGIDEKKKRLYKFTVSTDFPINLIITCDGENYYYTLDKYEDELNLDIRGEEFSFTIISQTNKARITAPTLYFSYLKESL